MSWIDGKKSYIVAFGVIVAAVVGYLTGDFTLQEAVNSALVGLGIGTLRHGMAK